MSSEGEEGVEFGDAIGRLLWSRLQELGFSAELHSDGRVSLFSTSAYLSFDAKSDGGVRVGHVDETDESCSWRIRGLERQVQELQDELKARTVEKSVVDPPAEQSQRMSEFRELLGRTSAAPLGPMDVDGRPAGIDEADDEPDGAAEGDDVAPNDGVEAVAEESVAPAPGSLSARRQAYQDYCRQWGDLWPVQVHGVPGAGAMLLPFDRGEVTDDAVGRSEAGAAGERRLAELLRDRVLLMRHSYWSLAVPDVLGEEQWRGDVDGALDLGEVLLLLDAKNYREQSHQYEATPDGRFLFAYDDNDELIEAHEMSMNMSVALDRFSVAFPDKQVRGAVVIVDPRGCVEHPGKGLIAEAAYWGGDSRLPIWTEADLTAYVMSLGTVAADASEPDQRLLDLTAGAVLTREEEFEESLLEIYWDVPD